MWTWRSWSRIFCLAGGLSAVGCTDYGSYKVSWTFVGDGPEEVRCGQHGVDSLRVTGMSTEGDGEDVTTLCAPGSFAHSVPVGTWTFTVQQLDVRGTPIKPTDAQGYEVPDPTATASVAADTERAVDPTPIMLTPRPACDDGVDNDLDGRVDLDDPECDGSSNTPSECRVDLDPECPSL
jgi:hypothetical protein